MVRETRHLWVGNLPDNIREDRIREHFKRYGRVQSVKVLARGAGGAAEAGTCAAVAFMDIKSAAKAHNSEKMLDERAYTTEYYEPAAIPSTASAGSSPAGSGYSASSGSVSSSRYHDPVRHLHVTEEGGSVAAAVGSAALAGGAAAAAAGAAAGSVSTWRGTNDSADRTEYRRGNTPAYTAPHHYRRSYAVHPPAASPSATPLHDKHHRWYAGGDTSAPSTPGGGDAGGSGGGGTRRRRRSGSAAGSSRSSSSSPEPSSDSRASTPTTSAAAHRTHLSSTQWSSSSGRPLAICVRNLPARSSDSSLKDGLYHEYKKHGKVAWVKVVGSNAERYAVVRFKKPSDVEKALEVSQDKLFFGCKISVAPHQGSGAELEDGEPARPYETDLDENHPKATRTLFIGNLEKDVTVPQLRDKFKHFGRIIEIDVKKQSGGAGYAFCQYATISSVVEAIRAMDGEYVGSSRVKLGFGKSMATACVWIDGLTEHTEKQEAFYEQLEKHGGGGAAAAAERLSVDHPARYSRHDSLRYETGAGSGSCRSRAASYSRSSGRAARYTGEHYDVDCDRRFRLYDDLGSSSPADLDMSRVDSASAYEETRSLQSVVVASPRRRTNRHHRRRSRDSTPDDKVLKERRRSGGGRISGETRLRSRSGSRRRHASETERRRHRHRRDECASSSRAGTPLRDELPEGPAPADPRRPPQHRERVIISLPLPKFAEPYLLRAAQATATPSAAVAAPASPPRAPSASSSSGGSAPHSPSLEERIRSLDEKYEKWSGSRAAAAESAERGRFRHKLFDIDINEVKPSDVARSLLAKRSVFDEDSERLEGSVSLDKSTSPTSGSPRAREARTAPRALQYPFPTHPPPPPSLPPSDILAVELDERVPANGTPVRVVQRENRQSAIDAVKSEFKKSFVECSAAIAERDSARTLAETCASSSVRNDPRPNRTEPAAVQCENLFKPADLECKQDKLSSDLGIRLSCTSTDKSHPDVVDKKHLEKTDRDRTNHDRDPRRDGQRRKSESLPCKRPDNQTSDNNSVSEDFSERTKCQLSDEKISSDIREELLRETEISTAPQAEQKDNCTSTELKESYVLPETIKNKNFQENNHETEKDSSIKKLKEEKNNEIKLNKGVTEIIANEQRDHEISIALTEEVNDNLEKNQFTNESVVKTQKQEEKNHKVIQKADNHCADLLKMENETENIQHNRRDNIHSVQIDNEEINAEQKQQIKAENIEKTASEHLKGSEMELIEHNNEKENYEKEQHKVNFEKPQVKKEINKEDLDNLKSQNEKLEKEKNSKENVDTELPKIEKELQKQCKDKNDRENDRCDEKQHHHENKKERLEKDKRKQDNSEVDIFNHVTKSKKEDKHKHDRNRKDHSETKREHRKEKEGSEVKSRDVSRKSSRDESIREMHRKDSSDSTTSRGSHESAKSNLEISDSKELKDNSKHSGKHKHSSQDGSNHRSKSDKEHIHKYSEIRKHDSEKHHDKLKEHGKSHTDHHLKEKIENHIEKQRHYSLDSSNLESKRKERLTSSSSLPGNFGQKRRMSSQDVSDCMVEESKRVKLESKIQDRRDSKESKLNDKPKAPKFNKGHFAKLLESKIKDDKKNMVKTQDEKYDDSNESSIKDNKSHTDKIKCDKKSPKSSHEESKLSVEEIKPESDIKIETVSPRGIEFLATLELRSSEEDEKQKALRKEMKEKKRIQQLQQIQELQMQQDAINQTEMNKQKDEKRYKNDDRKKEAAREKRMSIERKSRESDKKRQQKQGQSSDTSDSDEPKKHSIFDIVDDGPTYISMYDKVKARSCKNMQKQEEEKRQEKIKAKFSQLKQSRAKREEKKRSTSWDEDSDSEQDRKKYSQKYSMVSSSEDERNIRSNRQDPFHNYDMINKLEGMNDYYDSSSYDDQKNKLSRKNSRSRIMSDTSDDDTVKRNACMRISNHTDIKKERFSDAEYPNSDYVVISKEIKKESYSNSIKQDIEEKYNKHSLINLFDDSLDDKKALKKLLKIENNHVKATELFIKSEQSNKISNDFSSEGELSSKLSGSEIRKKYKKKQKKQKSSLSEEDTKSTDYNEKSSLLSGEIKHRGSAEKFHKHNNRKQRRKDKARDSLDSEDFNFDKIKSKKGKKPTDIGFETNKMDCCSNNIRRDEKMENIFGPLSDDSDGERINNSIQIKHNYNTDLSSAMSKDKMSFISKNIDDFMTKDKEKEESRRKKEKKRKEKRYITNNDENSLDVDAAGKAIEESLFADSVPENENKIPKTVVIERSGKSEHDESHFTDGDENLISPSISNELKHMEKTRRENKEKKKKKKKSKDERQNRHHHHTNVPDKFINDCNSNINNLSVKETDFISNDDLEIKIEGNKSALQSPSLPRLTDSPPPIYEKVESVSEKENKSTEEKDSSKLPNIQSDGNSTTAKNNISQLSVIPNVTDKINDGRKSTDQFIPGFECNIDEKISENAVKSISAFDNPSEHITSDGKLPISLVSKPDEKVEEKPRAVISQEETEDAVAALLGESFSQKGSFSSVFDEVEDNSSTRVANASAESENIPEEDAEEMRQAVHNLNASELEIKPDTPLSENGLQIDTDTEEQEETQQETPEKVSAVTTVSPSKPTASVVIESQVKAPQALLINMPITNKITTEIISKPCAFKRFDSVNVKCDQTQRDVIPPNKHDLINQITSTATPVISTTWTFSGNKLRESHLINVNSNHPNNRDEQDRKLTANIVQLRPPIPQNISLNTPPRAVIGTTAKMNTPFVINQMLRSGHIANLQPPTIKIPDHHVVYQKQGVVISPRLSGDPRLQSPKLSPQTDMPSPRLTILSPNPPGVGLPSPTHVQQRSPGHVTVVRMQQPPLSPIQTMHLPHGQPCRTMVSPNRPNSVLVQAQASPIHYNRLPVAQALTSLSKPVLSTNVMHSSKNMTVNAIPSSIHQQKIITELRKPDPRTVQDLADGSKLIISPSSLQPSTNPTVMAQNRLIMQNANLHMANKIIFNNTSHMSDKREVSHVPFKQDNTMKAEQIKPNYGQSPIILQVNQSTNQTLHSINKPVMSISQDFAPNRPHVGNVIHTVNSQRLLTTVAITSVIQGDSHKPQAPSVLSMAPIRPPSVLTRFEKPANVSVTSSVLSNVVMTPVMVKTSFVQEATGLEPRFSSLHCLLDQKQDHSLLKMPELSDKLNSTKPPINSQKESNTVPFQNIAVNDAKCETDFEELLNETTNEIKIPKGIDKKELKTPVSDVSSSSTNILNHNIEDCKLPEDIPEDSVSTIVKESEPVGKSDSENEIKDDNEGWSAKDVNIESVIKKVDDLCNNQEVNENTSDNQSTETKISDESSVILNGIEGEENNKLVEIQTDPLADVLEYQKTIASKRGGRNARGKKSDKQQDRVQTRQISKQPRGMAASRRGRGGRVKVDKKTKTTAISVPTVSGDVYDFHDDSGDETEQSPQHKNETRPRLILTIKSPHTTSMSTSTSTVMTSVSVVSREHNLDEKSPVASSANKDDKIEDFLSPAPNTRKSRRLQEKDVGRTTVDEVIDDVIKNVSSQPKLANTKDSGGKRTTRAKTNTLDKVGSEIRKSPRGGKRLRDRSSSETSVDSSDEKTFKRNDISPPDAKIPKLTEVITSVTEKSEVENVIPTVKEDVASDNSCFTSAPLTVSAQPSAPVAALPTPTPSFTPIMKPPKKMISEISAKLGTKFDARPINPVAPMPRSPERHVGHTETSPLCAVRRGIDEPDLRVQSPALPHRPHPPLSLIHRQPDRATPILIRAGENEALEACRASPARHAYRGSLDASLPRGAHHPPPPPPAPHPALVRHQARVTHTALPTGSPQGVLTGEGMYPHFSHPHYQVYQQHFRATQQDVRASPSPYTRSPREAEPVPRPAHSPSPADRLISGRGSPPPAHGGAGVARLPSALPPPGPAGPPHASQVPREADSLQMPYPLMWQGLLALKCDGAAVQMHFVHGNPGLAAQTLPRPVDGSSAPLRIAQRMRLEPVQLEAVSRKMQMENEHCMLLALPCGLDHMDVLQQSNNLTTGFITYLQRKQAAGIVNVASPGHNQPTYTVHIFPSCEFANENLNRIAPDLLHRVANIAHLLIVIATV